MWVAIIISFAIAAMVFMAMKSADERDNQERKNPKICFKSLIPSHPHKEEYHPVELCLM